jgi:class 3 adenylate cyclase
MGMIAVVACLTAAVRQVLAAVPGAEFMEEPWFMLTGVATSMTLAMALVALTSAWNFSKSSEFAIVGEPVTVDTVVIFVDMRGSTAWALRIDNSDRVRRFMNELRTWILRQSKEALNRDVRPELIKFLGDGYLLIWEMRDNLDAREFGLSLAIALQDGYAAFKRDLVEREHMPDDFPMDLGVGIAVGPALRLTSENGLRDYLGKAVNFAAKFQGMTRTNGGVVAAQDNVKSVKKLLHHFHFDSELQVPGSMTVGVSGTRAF